MPSAQVWKAVAEVLIKGLDFLHPSVQVAIVIGILGGVIFEIANIKMKGRFPISPMGMGLAFVLPFYDSWAMGLGAVIFYLIGRASPQPGSRLNRYFVENQETVCAGAIAGGSLAGIGLIILEVLVIGS